MLNSEFIPESQFIPYTMYIIHSYFISNSSFHICTEFSKISPIYVFTNFTTNIFENLLRAVYQIKSVYTTSGIWKIEKFWGI